MNFNITKIIDPTAIVTGGLVPKGAYNNATAYAIGDSVSYNNSSYVAIAATTGNLPTDTTHWQIIALQGATGATGPNGGDLSVMTTLGDTVYENGTPTAARLAGNTTTTKLYLTQTGTGSVSAAPAWGSVDLATGVGSSILPIANGGTGSATQNFVDLSTNQTVGGNKTFTGQLYFSSGSTLESIYYDGSGILWIANQDSSIGGRGNIKLSFSNTGGITFDQFGTGTVAFFGNSGMEMYKTLFPHTNNATTLGTSSLYWSQIYGSRLYLNSTAYLDGGTAGNVTVSTTGTADIFTAHNGTNNRTSKFNQWGDLLLDVAAAVFTDSIQQGDTNGLKILTTGGVGGQKLAFYGSTPIVQPLLATGAAHTVDDVITALQNLGLVRQT